MHCAGATQQTQAMDRQYPFGDAIEWHRFCFPCFRNVFRNVPGDRPAIMQLAYVDNSGTVGGRLPAFDDAALFPEFAVDDAVHVRVPLL